MPGTPGLQSKVARIDPDPDERRLDILVLYTDRAREEVGQDGIHDRVAIGLATLNASFANSNMPYTANVVAVERSPLLDVYEDSVGEFLNTITFDPSTTKQPRERYGADLVMFFKADSEDVGIGGRASLYVGRPIAEEREIAFAAIKTYYSSNGSAFAHEIGHMLGGGHQQPERGWKNYSSSFVCGGARDPLLPENRSADVITSRYGPIPAFSSPELLAADGTPCGDAAIGDNARTIREAFPAVSAYTPRMQTFSTVSLPTAPIEVDENAGTVAVQLLRTGDLSKRASVEVAAVPSGDRPAVAGQDFTRVLKRVAFEAGIDRLDVVVPIIDNTDVDSVLQRQTPKQLSVVIRYPSAADIANDETVIRILDNDVVATPTPVPTATPVPTPSPTATPAPSGGGGGGAFGHWALLMLALAGLRRARGALKTDGVAFHATPGGALGVPVGRKH